MRKFSMTLFLALVGFLALAPGRSQLLCAASQQPMLRVGQTAPNFALPDQNGKIRRISDYRGKIVLLAFYPADFTKGCTLEAHVNTEYYKKYLAAGITPIGVSVQTPQSHKAFCERYGIPYTILADTHRKAASLYGILTPPVKRLPNTAWFERPKLLAKIFHENNPGSPGKLAKRVTFIIGPKGKIAYIDTQVDRHISTCAPDWIHWVKTHKI